MRLLERVLLSAASSPMRLPPSPLARSGPISANLFGDIMGDALKEQKPYDRPLLPSLVKKQPASYQLQEKMFSFSGEDFRVRDLSGQEVITIDGGNINLGGWVLDKLAFKEASSGAKFCSVERRAIAASTCYDIYSADGGECVAKVEREWMSMTPKYKVGPPESTREYPRVRQSTSDRPAGFAPSQRLTPRVALVPGAVGRGHAAPFYYERATRPRPPTPHPHPRRQFYYEGDANPFADFEAEGAFP